MRHNIRTSLRLALLQFLLIWSAWAQAPPSTQCVSTALAGGTSDALTIPQLPCSATSTLLVLTLSATNTTTTPTLQQVGVSAPQVIVNSGGGALQVGALQNGARVIMNYNGVNWFLLTVSLGSATTTNLTPFVPDLTSLENSCVGSSGCPGGDLTFSSGVWRITYGNGNSAAPLWYNASSSACTHADTGGQVNSADGKCWIASFPDNTGEIGEWGAKGDGSTPDTTAIQAAMNFMAADSAQGPGGKLVVANRQPFYLVTGTLSFPQNLTLEGLAPYSSLFEVTTDTNVISTVACPSGNGNMAIKNMAVFGYQHSNSTTAVLTIASNCNVVLENDNFAFGSVGINTAGVDGNYFNTVACGYNVNVESTGANHYMRFKNDCVLGSPSSAIAFQQTSPGGENHMIDPDFSGSYLYSVSVQDTGNTSITLIDQGVFSSAVRMTGGSWLGISNTETGASNIVNSSTGLLTITGSFGTNTVTNTGGGTLKCANNDGMTGC